MNRKLEAELGVWKSENEDLRCRIRDVQVKSSAEVAVWKFQAEGLENDFLKKANAEISIWKLDAEMSKKKLAGARDETSDLRYGQCTCCSNTASYSSFFRATSLGEILSSLLNLAPQCSTGSSHSSACRP